MAIILGNVTFTGFEAPEDLRVGGEQTLIVQKLPGGARTIDAMGSDHRDIGWSGRFRGGSAESRARLLDGYRNDGLSRLLTWSGYRYRVIVKSFEATYLQRFEIPYSLSCVVLADESAPISATMPGIDEIIGADLGKLLGLSGPLSIANVTTAVESVQAAVSAAGAIKAASKGSLVSLVGAITSAQGATQGAIDSTALALGMANPLSAGGDPSGMAASLAAQAEGFGKLDQLYQASSSLARMGKNLGNLGS